jgi:hypothetical protein
MPKHPTYKAVKFTTLETAYGASFFRNALSRYIIQLTDPNLTSAQIEREANSFDVPFNAVPVFQRIKFSTSDPYANDGPADSIVDSIHVQPQKVLKSGDHVPARFDTAIVNTGLGGKAGIGGRSLCDLLHLLSKFRAHYYCRWQAIVSLKYEWSLLCRIDWPRPFSRQLLYPQSISHMWNGFPHSSHSLNDTI